MGFFVLLSDTWQFNKNKKRYTLIQNNLQKSEVLLESPTYVYMLDELPTSDKGCSKVEIKMKTLLKKAMCCYRGPGLFRKSFFQLLLLFRQLNSLLGGNFNRHFQVLKACQKSFFYLNRVELKFVTQVFKEGL